MNLNFPTTRIFLYALKTVLITGILFFSCKPDPIQPPEPEPVNRAPVAQIFVSPSSGTSPLTSTIKVNGTDLDGIDDIKNYILKIEDLGINIEKNEPIDTTMIFDKKGKYEVKGIVRDKAGASSEKVSYLNVSEKPQAIVSQNVSLEDSIDILYNINFENTSEIELEIIKNGEKIFSKNISDKEYSERFSYSTNDKITKGDYEFVAKFKNEDGNDTSVVSTVQIPNYNPEVDWSGLDINFEEDLGIVVNLPVPKDKNPEDNPVSYIPESFSSNKSNLEFNSEDNSLKINGIEDMFGSYNISAEFGSDECGINSVSKSGLIYELARVSGIVESNESHEGVKATIIPYHVIGKDTIRLYSNCSDDEERILTNAHGEFEFKLDKKASELEEVLLMARQGTPGDYKGWVRVQNIPKKDFKSVLVRTVPYAPYADRKDEFKEFVFESTKQYDSDPLPYIGTRFDFDGTIIGGLADEYQDFKGLERIRILDYDPWTEGVFTREEQEVFKEKLLDKENINGIIGHYEIKPEQIVFGNDTTFEDYIWNENFDPAIVYPSQGIIVVVPRKNLFASGVADGYGLKPFISRGTVYLNAKNNDNPRNPGYNEATFSHEMGHIFISSGHPKSLYGETIMSQPIPGWMDYTRTGPADKKLGYIAYEDSYLIKLDEPVYKLRDMGMDDIKNILRDDFK
ncbi:MAG: hypothetical protein K0B11_11215 [Mariniphaga sp.]|nr:hypothetical protein [Mariniphaga sp.]